MKSSSVQLHTTVHASNLKRLQLCRLFPNLFFRYVSGSDRSTHLYFDRALAPFPLRFLVWSRVPSPPNKTPSKVQSAGESGKTCVGARRGHALVSSPLFDSPHLRIGRRKCRISDVIRLVRWGLRSPFVCRRALSLTAR